MGTKEDPFEDEQFVERFINRRCETDSVNRSVDEPAVVRRVQSLQPRSVLELGCATGLLTSRLATIASQVVAIDRSRLMIDKARKARIGGNISFVCCDLFDFSHDATFDLVLASMTVHLIEDFKRFVDFSFNALADGGRLIFTQRHPIRTSNPNGASNDTMGWTVGDYFHSGRREYEWLGSPVRSFHRPLEEIFSTLTERGFLVTEIAEPKPERHSLSDRVRENTSSPSVLLVNSLK